jgi:hypothetical protein
MRAPWELVNMLYLQRMLHERHAVLLAQLLFMLAGNPHMRDCQAHCWQHCLVSSRW